MHVLSCVVTLCTILAVQALNRPPNIYLQPEDRDIYFKPLELATIPCIADGIPKPTYTWQRNGEAFNASGNDDRIVQLPNEGTIVFNSPEDKDEGIFQCFADNGYGVSASVKINFREAKLDKFVYDSSSTISAHLGQSLTLPCYPPRSFPPADIFWVVKDPEGRWQAINFDRRVSMDLIANLRFTNVISTDDKGGRAYACMAINNFMSSNATGREHRIEISGSSEQKIAAYELWTAPDNQFCLKGGIMKLKCIFGGNPTPDVYWEKTSGDKILPPERSQLKSSGQELWITDLRISDAGNYQCMGLNTESTKRLTKSYRIIIESAPYWEDEPEDLERGEGEKATFICRANGVPPPTYSWFINGVPLETARSRDPRINSTRFTTPSTNNITLTDLNLEDHMNVQCNATNKHGYIWADVYLNVMGDIRTNLAIKSTACTSWTSFFILWSLSYVLITN